MTSMRTLLATLALPLALAACGGESEAAPEPTAEPPRSIDLVPPYDGEAVTTTSDERPKYPKGYPKKVAVSSLPDELAYDFEGKSHAVAIAPGVWTELAPGTTVAESAEYGTLLGWCASIKKYERKFDVEPRSNSCW